MTYQLMFVNNKLITDIIQWLKKERTRRHPYHQPLDGDQSVLMNNLRRHRAISIQYNNTHVGLVTWSPKGPYHYQINHAYSPQKNTLLGLITHIWGMISSRYPRSVFSIQPPKSHMSMFKQNWLRDYSHPLTSYYRLSGTASPWLAVCPPNGPALAFFKDQITMPTHTQLEKASICYHSIHINTQGYIIDSRTRQPSRIIYQDASLSHDIRQHMIGLCYNGKWMLRHDTRNNDQPVIGRAQFLLYRVSDLFKANILCLSHINEATMKPVASAWYKALMEHAVSTPLPDSGRSCSATETPRL